MPPPIALAVPERSTPPPGLELRPRHVKRWIDSLDLNVPFESGRALLRQVSDTNKALCDVDARIEILDACRVAAAPVLAELETQYAAAPLPLPPGPRSALGLAREIATALAIGYRIAIVESAGKLLATKKHFGTLLLRAMQATGARLVAAYKSYTPVPTGTWAELHETYLRAEELGMAREALDADSGDTIAGIYTDGMLLSLTDPYRLGQGETARVLRLLRSLAGSATLQQSRPATKPGGHFIVPCNTDKPPKPSIGKMDDTGGADWRLLDANAVVEKLHARLAAGARGQAALKKADAEIIGRLIRLWGDPPKRTARRDPGQNTVAISMGIDGVGHFVSLEPRVDLAKQDAMLKKGITMPIVPLPVDDQSEPIPVFEWDIVNESSGGLRVRRLGHTQQPIAIGEVAGIKMHGRSHWAIGAVRWVTVFEDGGMEFGLQFLAPMARKVIVSAWGSPSGTGLLLHKDGESTVLTSPNAYSGKREIELDDSGNQQLVKPADVVEVTHRFELFKVKSAY
jgi:hypothetical protein